MFFRGTGASFSPDVPFVDRALGKGLGRLGFRGGRARGGCVFAAVTEEQALGYAGDGQALQSVIPLPGSVVTWAKGTVDLVLEFEVWLADARFDPALRLGRGVLSLLRDIGRDSQLLDIYLSHDRQKKNIETIVDAFLSTVEIRETDVTKDTDLLIALDGHRGEVWINGPCRIEERVAASPAPGGP